MRSSVRALLSCISAWAIMAGAASADTISVGPSDAWCDAINGASAGDEVVLAPGDYDQPCSIRVSGSSGSPVVVRSMGSADGMRARMTYSGSSSNIIDLRQIAWVVIRDIDFPHSENDVDGIKIHGSSDVTIEGCHFTDIGGISISANHLSSQRITIRDCRFENLRATALYLGCHNGTDCMATDLRVESNFFSGVHPWSASAVGYAMEIKLNSNALIRDNTIYDTRGPCITVYGSDSGGAASIVEGNYVEGSMNDAGINVSGGPAIVRNNVLVGNAHGGIWAQNYGGRGLQQHVWIVDNTLLDNALAGIVTQSWTAGADDVLAFNAISPRSGTPLLMPDAPAGTVMGNVDCSDRASCFVDAAAAPYDLMPAAGGPLIGAADTGSEAWRPTDDFLGTPRGNPSDVGAFEHAAGVTARVGDGMPRPARGTTGGADGGVPAADSGVPGSDAGNLVGGDGGVVGGHDASLAGPDAGAGSGMSGGCGCRIGRSGQAPLASLLALFALGLLLRRGRSR